MEGTDNRVSEKWKGRKIHGTFRKPGRCIQGEENQPFSDFVKLAIQADIAIDSRMAKRKADTISEYHIGLDQPKRTQFALHDLGPYLDKNGQKARQPHIHSYYQIIWFRSGKGKHYVDFREYEVASDSIFFIAKDQVHYFDGNSRYAGYLLHFNEEFLAQNSGEASLFLKSNLFSNPYQTPSCCVGSGIENILKNYLKLITVELEREDDFGREELLRMYLKAFLIQAQRRKIQNDGNAAAPSFQADERRIKLSAFLNLIDGNYKKGLTIAEYARKMNVSSRTLSELTGQALGKKPSLMIQERIVLEAKRMLLHSELNINQIAYKLGFEDPSYFVKYFKKRTSISPSEFRQSIS